MLIRQVNQKSALFVTTGIFSIKGLSFNQMSVSMDLRDIAILNIHGANYCCIISRISKSEAINLLKKVDLTEKYGTL